MSAYSIMKFLHIVAAISLFAGMALEQAGLRGLRRAATIGALREWLAVMNGRGRIDGPAALLLLVTGGYMAVTNWGMRPWIGLAVLGLILMGVIGGAGSGRMIKAILSSLPTDDRPIPSTLRQRLDSPLLWTFASLRATLGLGVVFIMTVKPAATAAALALVVAAVLGLAPRIRRHERVVDTRGARIPS